MRKYEKFTFLQKYYEACHEVEKYQGACPHDDTYILFTNAKAEMRQIEYFASVFYTDRPESSDAIEMRDRMKDLRELAASDASNQRWTTGKALWKMFEAWCIDDDGDLE